MQNTWCVVARFCDIAHALEIPVFYCPVRWSIGKSKCFRIELKARDWLVWKFKISQDFVCSPIPNFQAAVVAATCHPFCVGRHLQTIYLIRMLSEASDWLPCSCIPKLHFCILAACDQQAIIVGPGESSACSQVALEFDYLALVLEVPNVCSSTLSTGVKPLVIIRKRKTLSGCFLAS